MNAYTGVIRIENLFTLSLKLFFICFIIIIIYRPYLFDIIQPYSDNKIIIAVNILHKLLTNIFLLCT